MAPANEVIEKDNGLAKFFRNLKAFAGLEVVVGITAADGAQVHEDSELTVAEIGAVHEFGTDTIPKRSFLRDTYDANAKKYGAQLESATKRVTKGEDPKKGLFVVGETVRADVVDAFNANIPPPLADSTIEAKDSSLPLVDTGNLRGSIRSQVRKAGRS